MTSPGSPRLVDSFTAPKEVLQEFAELAEAEDYDPFAETASKRQIASRQSDYHNRRFNREAHESADVFQAAEDGDDVEGGQDEVYGRLLQVALNCRYDEYNALSTDKAT